MENVVGRGTLLAGRYRTLQPLASDLPGATSWEATDQILDRPVRVTVLHAGHVPQALDAARRAALVTDPRLVRVLDVGEHEGVAYTVTEQVTGPSLAELVARGPLPADQARAIVGEAAAALEAARRRGVHHLTLRPSVLHLTPDDRVLVTGLAVDGALLDRDIHDAATATRADTVGLVRLLYAALTGRWPGAVRGGAAGPMSHLAAAPVLEGAPVPPAELTSGVPNDLDTLCAVTLGVHDDGPQTPAELVQELEPWGDIRATDLFAGTQVLPPIASAAAPAPVPTVEVPTTPARVQRTSVRTVFAGNPSSPRPGTPPPAVPSRSSAFTGPVVGAAVAAAGPAPAAPSPPAATGSTAPPARPVPDDAPTTAMPTSAAPTAPVRTSATPTRPTTPAARKPAAGAPAAEAPNTAVPAAAVPATAVPATAATTAVPATPEPTTAARTTPVPSTTEPTASAPTAPSPTTPAASLAKPATPTPASREAATPTPAAPQPAPATPDAAATTRLPATRPDAPRPPAAGRPTPAATPPSTPARASTPTRAPAPAPARAPAPAAAPARTPVPAPASTPRPPARAETPDAGDRAPLLPGDTRPAGPAPTSTRETIAAHRFDPTRFVLLLVGLAIVVGLFAAYRALTQPVDLTAGTPDPVATATAPAEVPAEEPAAEPEPDAEAPATAPVIASALQLDPPPEGDDNEHPEAVPLAIDGDPTTTWFTRTYNEADFGNLKSGIGYAVTLAEPATVTTVTLQVLGSGGRVELRATDPSTPTQGDVLAEGTLGPETVLTLSAPTEAQHVVLWFTELPQAADGSNRLELAEVTLS